MTASGNAIASARTFAADVINGFLEVTHNGFALLGLAVAFVAIALSARPDLRQAGEDELRGWLHERRVAEVGFPLEPTASERAVAMARAARSSASSRRSINSWMALLMIYCALSIRAG